MQNIVLKTTALTKSFRSNQVLKDVSIQLEEGRIYGLIGPNGAGKTTLMKCVTGLSFPTSGQIELFGKTGVKKLQAERKRIGSMIEQPSITANMTAKENLNYHRMMRGLPNEEMIEELLTLVGLSDTNKKSAKDFSLGMKQRLGIAIALLGNPDILILDEPINGLDPSGVVEIRLLLKKLCEERQMTILLSSHNLPELYQTATDYIIIDQGEIKQQLTLVELDDKCRHYLSIACSTPEKLASVLETKLQTQNFIVMPDKSIKLYDYLDDKEHLSTTLYENGIIITEFSAQGDTLESYFLSIVGGMQHV